MLKNEKTKKDNKKKKSPSTLVIYQKKIRKKVFK